MEKSKLVNVRFMYAGNFRKTVYSGGETLVVNRVDSDELSYTVVMEYVKDYLHYPEIGGVYTRNEKVGGWKLLTDDQGLIPLINECKNEEEIILYVDNIVDKNIKPLNQMQPHVIIRPRQNLIQVSASKPAVKRKFVTRNQLQQQKQQQQKQRFNKNSPDQVPRRILSPRSCKNPAPETSQHVPATSIGTARRKLCLPKGNKEGENSGEADVTVEVPPVKVNKYEQGRIDRIRENREVLKELGLDKYAPKEGTVQQSKDKKKSQEEESDDDNYVMENEMEDGSDDSTERPKIKNPRKILPGPTTRLRANTTAATEKEVTIIKPTCSKLLKQAGNLEGSGSISAYMALRERQKQNLEADPRTEDVSQSNLPDADEEVQLAPKRPRGRTKMSKVHGRTPGEKFVINLNSEGQPIGDDGKVLTELSNFLGTVVRDNVSLTYVNWHVVPEETKEFMWKYTLDRYLIPDEGKSWVNKTLNSSWRVHKSRMKNKHYLKYETDEERKMNKPDEIPLDDFELLLKYWAEEGVQSLAEENSARRNCYTEPHTLGRKSLAQVRNKLKREDPNQASPSDAKIYLNSRTRKKGRNYKSNTDVVKKRIDEIQKLVKDGKDEEANLSTGKSHGRKRFVGRSGKSVTSTPTSSSVPQPSVEELTAKIHNLESEMEAKLNRRVEEMFKRLGEANPGIKIDMGQFGATTSSAQEENGTPITPGCQGSGAIV